MDTSEIRVEPLTARIGALIHGVDLAAGLSDTQFAQMHQAWLDHHVLFFRDQVISLDEHRDFARRFGELYVHPTFPGPEGYPEVLVIRAGPNTRKAPGQGWHTDVSAAEAPPSASILRLEEVPPVGGDTVFCSMYAAYDALSPDWKRFIEPLNAHHSAQARHGGEFGHESDSHPEAIHPVVRTHPETGRQALYVNQGFTKSIEGMSKAESRAVLDFLFAHCENAAFHVRFKWQANSIAIWDNRCVMHNAIHDYFPNVRRGYRVTVKGDRPAR